MKSVVTCECGKHQKLDGEHCYREPRAGVIAGRPWPAPIRREVGRPKYALEGWDIVRVLAVTAAAVLAGQLLRHAPGAELREAEQLRIGITHDIERLNRNLEERWQPQTRVRQYMPYRGDTELVIEREEDDRP